MPEYKVKDLLNTPTLLSLARVPLGLAFFGVLDGSLAAFVVLALAAATDVLDGWLARRYDQVTSTGAVVDGLTDKFFMFCVVLALLLNGKLEWWGVILLAVREIGEAPLVLLWAVHGQRRKARAEARQANVAGKLATVIQFAAVLGAIAGSSAIELLLPFAGLAGAAAATRYWRRELRGYR